MMIKSVFSIILMGSTIFSLAFGESEIYDEFETVSIELEEVEFTDVLCGGGDDGSIDGYLIHTDTAVAFLQHVLEEAGFNSEESAEMITFWTPRIIDQKYALIQFKIDEAFVEKISKIKVGLKPDQLKKVYMVFSNDKTEEIDVETLKKKLTSFDRNGFTVVKWSEKKVSRPSVIEAL